MFPTKAQLTRECKWTGTAPWIWEQYVYSLQKPTTSRYIEYCCKTAARNGGFFCFPVMNTKPDVLIHHMESQVVINISEYRAAAMYSETEVQVFPKQLKQLTKIQNVKTQKE